MHQYKTEIQKVLKKFSSDPKNGLTSNEANLRLLKYGENTLSKTRKNNFLKKLIAQFSDFTVITLIIASAISCITSYLNHSGNFSDSIIIISIVIVNAVIGILQESKAEKEIESLKKIATPLSKVIRDGKPKRIPSKNVVPGDILVFRTGDLVSADSLILECSNLAAEESAMTGEAFSVNKSAECSQNKDTLNHEKENMLFAGSIVTRGNAKAIAVATGMNTEIGEIASMVSNEKTKPTPLQKSLPIQVKNSDYVF